MVSEEKSTFRYFTTLPVHLEPDYKHGYTCDSCSGEFEDGPFFHCSNSGRDMCVDCGAKIGLCPFSALVSKVATPPAVWKNAHKGTVVLLCYQIHSSYYGCYFSDGSNLLICFEEGPSYFIETNSTIENAIELQKCDLQQKFPWSKEAVEALEGSGARFHPTSACKDRSRLCFLTSYRVDGLLIELRISDGYCELIHCTDGVILVLKETDVVLHLSMNSPVRHGRFLPKAACELVEWFLSQS
ncbi:hypothetical protein ERJ75_001328900 [Trypanosoma vivax]|uniref:Uncharacterized protein n=1 Tax=Trypanosoma vivax (strain Y486) TaxID=1055687 RepID=G0U155_TRYVY|nr:hypothetical protein TRVL_06673 [Trypanosoma vivax]KAH8608234.1 hypothetical protein ERJ75_001328900 [Trypanosoma vivax]CCC49810.1 conserved hypothetical protein [Trypanosoma vivax Y486]